MEQEGLDQTKGALVIQWEAVNVRITLKLSFSHLVDLVDIYDLNGKA